MWRQLLEDGRSACAEHCPHWPYGLLVPAAVGLGGALLCWKLHGRKIKTIELGEGWWGPGEKPPNYAEDTRVRPFIIEASEADIEDLHQRLDATRFFAPLEDVRFIYGFNSSHLRKVISYWRNRYDWKKQVKVLNKYPHYKTNIEGLDIHFIHVKPSHVTPGQKVYPLLMVHGWPGSFYEFYHILPLLTDPGNHGLNPEVAFEVVCPSIPGYGFSDASSKMGFSAFAAARIFYKLMLRLGFNEFYLQGGDWGSRITTLLSQMKPGSVKGLHLNFVIMPTRGLGMIKSLVIGRYLPWLVGLTREDVRRLYPYMEKHVFRIMRETGYLHIQIFLCRIDSPGYREKADLTQVVSALIRALQEAPDHPDAPLLGYAGGVKTFYVDRYQEGALECPEEIIRVTDQGWDFGSSLNDSPAGLAAYILEKFSTWTDNSFRELEDGGLDRIGVHVPTGMAAFPCELEHTPRVWAKQRFQNIVSYTYMPRGGHFAAFEEPELLARDIQNFVSKVEKVM